jgi:putative hydrolase of the HAD superfamily
MKGIKAVFFDLDNTLLDRTRAFRHFANDMITAYFGHLDDRQAVIDRIVELDQDGYKDRKELYADLVRELPWPSPPQLAEWMAFYDERYVKNAVLMERATDVLQRLKKTYILGLITNGRTAIQHAKVDHLGIRDAFRLILVSEETGIKKPDPRIFRHAMDRLQLSPGECLYIGDHPVNDMEGAANAGMQTIWVKRNQPWRDGLTAKPLRAIERLDELLELL